MKTALQSLLAISVLIGSTKGHAQGTVDFANNRGFATSADRLVRDVFGNPLVGANYRAQLYFGSPGAPAADLIAVTDLPAQFRIATTTLPGTWDASSGLYGSIRTLEGFIFQEPVSLQVRVWDSVAGANWEEAMRNGVGATQYGISAAFLYLIPAIGEANPFAYTMDNFRGFTLVPEPSVWSIGAVGAVVLWFMRRRGKK
jgi:hypothetical protein